MTLKTQMNRRCFLAICSSALLGAASPAQAAIEDDLIRQLKKQGYKGITVSSTLLGRTRIIARKNGGLREIILNPLTGEILRDLWTGPDGSQKSPTLVKSGGEDDVTDDTDTGDDGTDDGGSDDGTDDGGSDDDGSDDSGDDNSGSDDSGDDEGDDKGEDKGDDKGEDKGDDKGGDDDK